MKVLSIIGIILFSWLFYSRCSQFFAADQYLGVSICYSSDMIGKLKLSLFWQVLVSVYAIIFSIVNLFSIIKQKGASRKNISEELVEIHNLHEKGIINTDEYDRLKKVALDKHTI